MILRDHLAYDRTVLANERTLLSYLRSAIVNMDQFLGGAVSEIYHPGVVGDEFEAAQREVHHLVPVHEALVVG